MLNLSLWVCKYVSVVSVSVCLIVLDYSYSTVYYIESIRPKSILLIILSYNKQLHHSALVWIPKNYSACNTSNCNIVIKQSFHEIYLLWCFDGFPHPQLHQDLH